MRRLLLSLLIPFVLLTAAAAPAQAAGEPQLDALALNRYYDGSAYHWITPFPVSASFGYERTLGYLLPGPAADRTAIYDCAQGADHLLSADPTCEGGTGRLAGFLWATAPAGIPSTPVYRCLDINGSHFASDIADCEGSGRRVEALLGYTRTAGTSLLRYVVPSGQHWAGNSTPPAGATFERSLGRVLPDAGPGRNPLYNCANGQDQFLTGSADCEGAATNSGLVGYLYAARPTTELTDPVYRCARLGFDHIISPDENCEGQTKEGLLGYAPRFGKALQRWDSPATGEIWVTPGGVGPGYQYTDTLGFLQPVGGAGLQALYGCRAGTDTFLSLDATCAGQTVEGRYGFTYTRDQDDGSTVQLYACSTAGSQFAGIAANCDNQRTIGSLGFIRRAEGPLPAASCTTSAATVPSTLDGRTTRTYGFGKRPVVKGIARDAGGAPIAGAGVTVIGRNGRSLAGGVAGTDGGFAIRVPAGANRVVRAGLRASADDASLACGPALRIEVRAGVDLRAPKSVRRGKPLRLRGTVKGSGVPRRKTVVLQAFDRGRWRTFKTVRTRKAGRFVATYRFSRGAARKRYPFRAVATTERGFPYAKGTSRTRKVRVR